MSLLNVVFSYKSFLLNTVVIAAKVLNNIILL